MTYTDLIFLLGLFPLSAILSLLDRSAEFKNLILILTSILFFSWGRPFAVCLILVSSLVDWLLGLGASAVREKTGGSLGALPFVLISAGMNIALLLVFTQNTLFEGNERITDWRVYLPLGMAYYTLRGFSYVFDVFKGKIKAEKNYFCIMTYMCCYPFAAAGPVVRYGEMVSQIRSREVGVEVLNRGLNSLVIGLGKAIILAPAFNTIRAAGLTGSEITTAGSWLGMLSFFAYHYFTFTGLCDMSRGFCLMNGFVLPGNYREIDSKELFTGLCKSYNSSVIGLFSDVLGIAPGGNPAWCGIMAVVCGGLMGLWYAPTKMTLCVGLAAGALAGLEILGLRKLLGKLPALFRYVYLILASMLIFGAVYFTSFASYGKWVQTLAGIGVDYTLSVALKEALLHNLTLIVIAFFVITPGAKGLVNKALDSFAAKGRGPYGAVRTLKTICTAGVFIISVITMVAYQYAGTR